MICFVLPDVAEAGAVLMPPPIGLMRGDFADEAQACRTGNPGQCRGVALAAAEMALNEDYTQASIKIARPLLDDEDDGVRTHCGRVLYSSPLVRPEMMPYLEAYVPPEHFVRTNGRLCMP